MSHLKNIPFDNTYARLPERFFSRQQPSTVPQPRLVRVNDALARELGISSDWLRSEEGVAMLCGNAVAKGSEPLAQAYAGHQFGNFVPQLGDGRALLLGEVVDVRGARRDIQLKGSGRTVFSRGGDGKAALGPALREYLVSEAMHALGVPSTRALAVVSTGEKVMRETPIDGAVFTRVAASHLRVGTFEYFAVRQDTEALQTLADYAIARHYPSASNSKNHALALLSGVISAQAMLIPRWLGLGFIHGVMNTDNCAISGETIDFGPCAFMDAFHPRCVFSAFDRNGRYAWGNQLAIAGWNLTRFAETLLPLLAETTEASVALAQSALDAFGIESTRQFIRVFGEKLGLPAESGHADGEPMSFIKDTLNLLAEDEIDFTLFFRQLTRVAGGADADAITSLFAQRSNFENWMTKWRSLTNNSPRLAAMRAANPVLIPRNHRVEQAIQSAYRGDFAPFHRLTEAWQTPYVENPANHDLEATPLEHEAVRQTFCGT